MNLKKIFIFMMVGICLFQLPVANAKNNSAKNIQTKITTEKIEKSMINSIRFSKASDKVRVDTEKEAAIISMMRMAEWCVTAG